MWPRDLITIEAAYHENFSRISSDFTSINASIEAFQNEIIQHYTGQQSVTNQSETSSQSYELFFRKFFTTETNVLHVSIFRAEKR